MKRFVALSVVFVAVALFACANHPAPDIQADSDPSADFASYRTFGYASPLGTEVDGYSSAITNGLKSATRRELEVRGYRYQDGGADLLVNFGALLAKKGNNPLAETQHVGYYGYRKVAVYQEWPSYAYRAAEGRYTEGTINIDLVDAKRAQLVWEAVAIGRVKDESLDNPGPGIDQVVAEMFSHYKHSAGH
jgi:hypothetical protein